MIGEALQNHLEITIVGYSLRVYPSACCKIISHISASKLSATNSSFKNYLPPYSLSVSVEEYGFPKRTSDERGSKRKGEIPQPAKHNVIFQKIPIETALDEKPSSNAEEVSPPQPKKKRVPWSQLSNEWKRQRTSAIFDQLELLIREETALDPECAPSINQLLGYLVYRTNYVTDKRMADLGRFSKNDRGK